MLATDPLSDVFIACVVFAGVFLVATSVLGMGHVHLLHLGSHAPAAHGIGAHAPVAHGQPSAHTAHTAHTAHSAAGTAAAASSWDTLVAALSGGLSLYGVLMFLLVFGLLGYILHNAGHANALVAITVPLVLGALAAVGTGMLLRMLFITSPESEITAANSRPQGQLGTITAPIRAGGIGEVTYARPGGGRLSVSARSADGSAIAAGEDVVVLGYSDGIADVQPWDRFLSGARNSAALQAEPPDHSTSIG